MPNGKRINRMKTQSKLNTLIVSQQNNTSRTYDLKGHTHAILVNFKSQKYVLTSMNTHK